MATDPALRQAIDALRTGDRTTAQALLHDLTRTQPSFSDGWLWLAAASDDRTQKQTYLQQVLTLSPTDQRAQAGLRVLGVDLPPATTPTATPPATTPRATPDQKPATSAASQPVLAQPSFAPTGVRARTIPWHLIALVAVVLLVLIPLALFMF